MHMMYCIGIKVLHEGTLTNVLVKGMFNAKRFDFSQVRELKFHLLLQLCKMV